MSSASIRTRRVAVTARTDVAHVREYVEDREVTAWLLLDTSASMDFGPVERRKHVVLTGPPGTGKTTLAYLAADVGQQAMLCTGYLPTTATTEWTTFETIGGFQPTLSIDLRI